MFQFCTTCASPHIRFEAQTRFQCPDCGFVYYHNIAAATGCIIHTDKGILFLLRAKEPALGKLDLPGGFVSPGESAVAGLRRECLEEIGWDPGPELSFFASFPNTYPYQGILYNTCDMYFTLSAPALRKADLCREPEEIGGIQFIQPAELRIEDLAFDSTRRVIQAFLDRQG
ncbi:MAG: NUDIX domain-containing protein [Spirochaetaceae bacterium]|jgi:8-oxo-dGTP pyrophosphatase MutT (NUDIX family)|nr:NUDIX domain-containing protein [Spirochaetaceae bacterium]